MPAWPAFLKKAMDRIVCKYIAGRGRGSRNWFTDIYADGRCTKQLDGFGLRFMQEMAKSAEQRNRVLASKALQKDLDQFVVGYIEMHTDKPENKLMQWRRHGLLKEQLDDFVRWQTRRRQESRYRNQQFKRFTERPMEYAFVFRTIARMCPETVLDVGTGVSALPSLLRTCGPVVTACDNIVDYWGKDVFNPHYLVLNDDITQTKLDRQFDLVVCVSVLEHIEDFDAAVASMSRLTRPGGHMILTFPYCEHEFVDNVYRRPEASYNQDVSYIGRVYCREQLDAWMLSNDCEIVEQEYWQMFTGRFWTFGERILPPRQVAKDDLHQLTCLLIRKK